MRKQEVYIFDALPTIPPTTPEMSDAARMVVCGNAHDVDDAMRLLDMLGLLRERLL